MGTEKDEPKEELKVATFRMPKELYAQLKTLKQDRAHPLIADTAFFVEALKLYIALGMERGLTSSLEVQDMDSLLHRKGQPKKVNAKHHPA